MSCLRAQAFGRAREAPGWAATWSPTSGRYGASYVVGGAIAELAVPFVVLAWRERAACNPIVERSREAEVLPEVLVHELATGTAVARESAGNRAP